MHINFLAVLVASLAAFALGALWYSPILFGKKWQLNVGLKKEDFENVNFAKTYGTSFLLMFIMGIGLDQLLNVHLTNIDNFVEGAFHGAIMGFFFSAMSIGINYLYQQKTLTLYFIDATYQILFLFIMGGIISIMA